MGIRRIAGNIVGRIAEWCDVASDYLYGLSGKLCHREEWPVFRHRVGDKVHTFESPDEFLQWALDNSRKLRESRNSTYDALSRINSWGGRS